MFNFSFKSCGYCGVLPNQKKQEEKDMNNFSKSNSLKVAGWFSKPIGCYRSSGETKTIEGYELYIRETDFEDFLKKVSFPKSKMTVQTGLTTSVSNKGSNTPMGCPESGLTPTLLAGADRFKCKERNSAYLPELANFCNYPSLVRTRPDKPCILIGYDSEWQTLENGREMLSWQYSVVWNAKLIEFCFLKKCDKNLSLDIALGCIFDYLGVKSIDLRQLRRYQYCIGWDKEDKPIIKITQDINIARKECVYCYKDGVFIHQKIQDQPDKLKNKSERTWTWFHSYIDYTVAENIRITLLCHTGKVDISALSFSKDKPLLKYLTEVQGGLVSLQPVRLTLKSLQGVNNTSIYPVSLSVSDTMCHAPAEMKSLKNLGDVVGIQKVDIPVEKKGKMADFLNQDPASFLEYASTDSVVTLMYASALYGYNNSLPVTITSATAGVMKEIMMDRLGCNDTNQFNLKYRGLQKVSHGLIPRENRPGYIEATSLEPISDNANTIQYYASQAYHGGYNSCSEVGYFPFPTWDYDLQNAYPTVMCLVPDIDWENPIRSEVVRRNLDIRDWTGIGGINPLVPFVGYVRFKFPATVKYPCIPINVDGVPAYPRTSNGLDGVYAAGPYIYLALKLGANVYCERGYFMNTLYDEDYKESRSLAFAVKQLVEDRNKAKIECGKKSLEELILKTMVNSGYGKNAQNVVVKSSWTAFKDMMEELGCSAITNPVSAMMITSLVQCELLAAQNQIHERGYMSCSVTTDGFISNCPEEELKTLDLYGFRKYIEQGRIFLTGNPELWEVKHHQDDLLNFITRGNVSLLPHGVCAHNSTKSGYESDSYEDRLWLMTQVLNRTGAVEYTEDEWTSFKQLVQGKDFIIKPITRHIRMDFDMKRKPDWNTFHTDKVCVNGAEYEIAHFDTIPYEDVAEFRKYREKKKLTKVLKTEADWDIYRSKLEFNVTSKHITDMDWSILVSCIMGYRAGRWDIPALNSGSVEEKCAWINKHNTSKKRIYKPSDWKNARKPERQVNMLPVSMIQDKLDELISDTAIA